MLDQDTFLITLYVTIDDFCRHSLAPEPTLRGPLASLSRSEVLTLSLFGQWARFQSERDFWRFATQRLTHLFPRLPHLSQFNRLQRKHFRATLAFNQSLIQQMDAQNCAFEALDRCGVATRWCQRRGVGWLPEETNKGYCSRLGYFEGFSLLLSVTPTGIITGFAVGGASAKDQPFAEAFFQARQQTRVLYPWVGCACRSGDYVTDRGFNGKQRHANGRAWFGVSVIHARVGESRVWCRTLAGLRQVIESVNNCLLNVFRLAKERPHALLGFWSRLSAKVCLHNFCFWLNGCLDRPPLAFAELLGW